jgi:hypothetical protein
MSSAASLDAIAFTLGSAMMPALTKIPPFPYGEQIPPFPPFSKGGGGGICLAKGGKGGFWKRGAEACLPLAPPACVLLPVCVRRTGRRSGTGRGDLVRLRS